MKIKGTCQCNFVVDLDIKNFSEIDEDHMTIEKSDEIIADAIAMEYSGIEAKKIWVDPSEDGVK